MVRTLAKISLVLLIIVSLPMGFYLVREFSALSKNEEMVERVFSTQLESILYSINQYSENVVQQWSQSLDHPVDPQGELMQGLTENLFAKNEALKAVRFSDLNSREQQAVYFADSVFTIDRWPGQSQLDVLRGYLESNYQRVEVEPFNDKLMLYFLPKNRNGEQLCQLVVERQAFIQQNLSPMIQQVAHDIFYISIADSLSNQVLFTTGDDSGLAQTMAYADMWYLPGHRLGIRLKSKTLVDLATERTQRDNYMLMGVGLLVVLGFIFVVINIRKEMKLAEIKSEFVANVSHEIRTPLALISMYSETLLLKRVKTEEKQAEYLQTIHEESARLTGIVNRILNFSRIERNRIKYHFDRIDLQQALPEIVADFNAHLSAAHVECQCESGEPNAWVMADWESLKTLVGNLLDNAMKYSDKPEKRIKVRLLKKPNQVWIEVEDNGIGISAKHQKYIFDQFYRVTEGDLAHRAKGSGLGLNLVKRIMKAHGGSVSVQSKLGEGSTFSLKFPRKEKE
nr:HAMP domain-containing histidine kinase [Sunxiuqinia sp.]